MPGAYYALPITKSLKIVDPSGATGAVSFEPLLNNPGPLDSPVSPDYRARYRHQNVEAAGMPLMTLVVSSSDTSSVAVWEGTNNLSTYSTLATVTGAGAASVNQAWAYVRVRATTLDSTATFAGRLNLEG